MALDIVTEILIAELHRQGTLDGAALANISRRLEECGEAEVAAEVLGVPIGNAFDESQARRGTLHVVPDGGNRPPE